MKFRLSEIPDSGLHVEAERKAHWLSNVPEIGSGGNSQEPAPALASDIHFDFVITKDQKDISVEGSAVFTLITACSRCLERVKLRLTPWFHLVLTPKVEFGDDSDFEACLDYATYEGDEIELDDYLREVLAMELPYRVLCRDDCKGLCPGCGANMNSGGCSCPNNEWVDERFRALKELKIG